MNITCKNCDHHFKGHYCSNCGQSAETHKMNFHFLWHDIQHGLFHFDSGILYTAKQLFTRPGHAIREFIEGRRVKYFKPLSFVVILATVYGLLYHNFHINAVYEITVSGTPDATDTVEKVNEWVATHFSWFTLLTLPFYAVSSFLAFKKQGYNFVEHLVLNAFLAGQRLILHLAAFPLIHLFNGTPGFTVAKSIVNLLDFILLGWGYVTFFNKIPKLTAILLTLLSFIIFGFTVLIFSLLITWIILSVVGSTKH
jgi:hypothetical protein